MNSKVLLTALLLLVALGTVACDGPGSQAEQAPAPVVSEATLPTLTLTHGGRAVDARRFEGCWRPDPSADLQCVGTSPRGELGNYLEVESGDVIEIRITPDSLPSRLLATFFAQPGEIGVGDLLRLSPIERSLVIDMSPGRYNVRLHAQWFEGGDNVHHKVNYVFGITIPGEPGLESSCISTAAGGILGILLESLDDPHRTALDAVNGGGCTFNSRIASVVLILENDDRRYVETFRLEPPSLNVSLPLPEDTVSESTGGPLPSGLYSRRVVAVTVDGVEEQLASQSLGVIKLADGPPDPDAPIAFPQHRDGKRTYTTALPNHIEGRLQAYEGCIYIRNGTIPVWPSDFTMRLEDGLVLVIDESGNAVGVDGKEAVLAGYEVSAEDPEGRKISATLPLACPPGNFWIVGDEIGELKERARLTIVPLEGSALIFPRQSPGLWSDELSISTVGELVHEGDCLRVNDAERHMIIWPPLFTPHMLNGLVEIRDGDGMNVASVGDRLEMTGFGSDLMRPHYSDRCPGPYWTVGRITERR